MLEHHNDDHPVLQLHNPDILWNLEKLALICRHWTVDHVDSGGGTHARKSLAEIILGFEKTDNNSTAHARYLLHRLAEQYHHAKEADGTLPPLQGFLLAWLRQQEEPVRLLNAIPEYHRQLYYRDYLGLSPRHAVADKVLLVLKPEATLSQLSVPAGTRFDGGQDVVGTPLHYALDHKLWLNRGELSDIIVKTGQVNILQSLPEKPLVAGTSPTFQDIHDLDSAASCELFLGFTDLDVNQTLSLYWKVEAHQSTPVQWDYLITDNKWSTLEPVISDDTLRLSRSGLWSFTLPANAVKGTDAAVVPAPDNTSKTQKHWIRATFPEKATRREFHLEGIYINAMTATLQHPEQADASHFQDPLPAESVTQTVDHVSGLAGLQQPIASFGGIAAETEADFNRRIGQRLHHRQRAITLTDIKILLKARFPEIQAIATDSSSRNAQNLIVIPVPHERDNKAAPLKPTFNDGRRDAMKAYIKTLSSDRLALTINNPHYIDVVVNYDVVFRKGVGKQWGNDLLQQALYQRFMPWTQPGSTARIALGDSLNCFDMIAFIESLDYVEHIGKLELNRSGSPPALIINTAPGEVLTLSFPAPKP